MMTDWKPLPGYTGSRTATPTPVRITSSGQIYLARDVFARMGKPEYVRPAVNGRSDVFALLPSRRGPGGGSIRVGIDNGSTVRVSGMGVLHALKRDTPHRVTTLPHSWDGDVLVIDISALPMQEA